MGFFFFFLFFCESGERGGGNCSCGLGLGLRLELEGSLEEVSLMMLRLCIPLSDEKLHAVE